MEKGNTAALLEGVFTLIESRNRHSPAKFDWRPLKRSDLAHSLRPTEIRSLDVMGTRPHSIPRAQKLSVEHKIGSEESEIRALQRLRRDRMSRRLREKRQFRGSLIVLKIKSLPG